MLHDLLVFSPFMVCVIMGIIHCMVSYRTNAFLSLMIVIVTAGLFFMVDAYYSAIYGTSEVYIWFSLLYQIVAPSLIPVTMYYTVRLMKEVRYHPIQFLWIIIPSAMFAVSSLLMSIVGPKEIVEMTNDLNMNGLAALGKYKGQIVYRYYLWSEIVLRVVIALEMIYMILWMAVVSLKRKFKFKGYWRFLFKGESISVLQLQMVPMTIIGLVYLFKVFLFKNYLDAHLWITAILSLLVAFSAFFFDFFALFGARYTIHFNDFRFIVRFNYDRRRKQQIIEEMFDNLIEDADVETQRKIRGKIAVSAEVEAWEQENNTAKPSLADAIFNVASDSWSENSLMNRFQKLMKEEQLYLKPGLSLADVAERLGTNKTYVSKMVNNTFNMGFPELLNILRVDYAEHYIVLHKDAKQDKIAEACGFFSASSFNNTFKRITGMTPKMWVSTR